MDERDDENHFIESNYNNDLSTLSRHAISRQKDYYDEYDEDCEAVNPFTINEYYNTHENQTEIEMESENEAENMFLLRSNISKLEDELKLSENHNIISSSSKESGNTESYLTAIGIDDVNDELFQREYDSYQTVLKESKQSDKDRDSLRNELNSYLSQTLSKKGSDGKRLLSVPENFDVIASSMSRKDLESSEAAPWSKYLLDAKFGSDLNKNYQGRYKDVMETDDPGLKVKKGLAEIHLLDSQLLAITKKASFINKQGFLTDVDVTRATSNANSSSNTPRSARSDATASTTTTARGQAATFLTRLKGSAGNNNNNVESTEHFADGENSKEHAENEQREDGKTGKKKGKGSKDFITDNIKSVRRHGSSLTDEKEFRVKCLTDCSEEEFEKLLSNPMSDETVIQSLKQIDGQLEQYNRLDRLKEPEEYPFAKIESYYKRNKRNKSDENNNSNSGDNKDQIDEIEFQRLEKQRKTYEASIDIQLSACKQESIDLTGLVEISSASVVGSKVPSNSHSSSTTTLEKYSQINPNMSLDDVFEVPPNVNKIRTSRLITAQEVNEVLEGVRSIISTINPEVSVNQSSLRLSQQSADLGNISMAHSSSSSTLLSNVLEEVQMNRSKLDKLYSSVRSDVDRLAELRSKQRAMMADGGRSEVNSSTIDSPVSSPARHSTNNSNNNDQQQRNRISKAQNDANITAPSAPSLALSTSSSIDRPWSSAERLSQRTRELLEDYDENMEIYSSVLRESEDSFAPSAYSLGIYEEEVAFDESEEDMTAQSIVNNIVDQERERVKGLITAIAMKAKQRESGGDDNQPQFVTIERDWNNNEGIAPEQLNNVHINHSVASSPRLLGSESSVKFPDIFRKDSNVQEQIVNSATVSPRLLRPASSSSSKSVSRPTSSRGSSLANTIIQSRELLAASQVQSNDSSSSSGSSGGRVVAPAPTVIIPSTASASAPRAAPVVGVPRTAWSNNSDISDTAGYGDSLATATATDKTLTSSTSSENFSKHRRDIASRIAAITEHMEAMLGQSVRSVLEENVFAAECIDSNALNYSFASAFDEDSVGQERSDVSIAAVQMAQDDTWNAEVVSEKFVII